MSKLVWVFLPIAALAAWASARLALGRAPSRHALNILSSVLLLLYFAATAGLGIFWVANQQLPVFDWHYVFGYATVALVVLHLAYNLRVVVAYFRRVAARRRNRGSVSPPRPRSEAAKAGGLGRHPRPRLGRLALWGLGLASAFVLGTRYGGGGLAADWSSAEPRPSGEIAGAMEAIERFHEFSSHSRVGVFARAAGIEWGAPPPAFKQYEGKPAVTLPRPRAGGRPTREAVASTAPAETPSTGMDLAALSDVLFYSAGITRDEGAFKLRASPSSGALFPAELYVLAREVQGLPPGVYHYDPERHLLTRLSDRRVRAPDVGVLETGAFDAAPATLAVTAVFRRSGHKYRDRAYRYVAADTGHLLENLRIAASEAGLVARFIPRFDESRVASVTGTDGLEEGAMALVSLGERDSGPAASALLLPPDGGASARYEAAPPPEGADKDLGPTALAHRATSLRLVEDTSPSPDASPGIALPSPVGSGMPVRDAMAARRSRRKFSEEPVSLVELGSVLGNALRASPIFSQSTRVYVVANRVSGLEPGAYRYDPAAHALTKTRAGALAQEAGSAALSQDVIGGAPVVLVTTFDRQLLQEEGPRGYRHAFFEAGMIGERVYLEAEARGLGACSVGAFYDDEAARLLGVPPAREWVAHFQALGRL
ncbi:SagB/ThcOx family dehydrogenase [Archangium violaceum]|uniref:SagB/ThcOx family dehydrogenase n=1 Tax=Archangium violaceum TaxID=83451 RepID=UPI00193B933B|nr:SagB family peptide dehydrogenase [Archangium violaceum]QRK04747.1 SagB/ThcOx family dehydrogenase [Archangium violaceum]